MVYHCRQRGMLYMYTGYCFSQSTYFPRDEIGLVCLPTQLGAYTATLLVMVNVIREGGRAPPTLTSQG
jgi:hypothetical protein